MTEDGKDVVIVDEADDELKHLTLAQYHNTTHKNGQPRDIGNIGYTRHMTKTNNLETLATLGTQDT
jgi:hypothetical protein